MSEYTLNVISPQNLRGQAQMDKLLEQEGIQRDGHLDYSIGLYDEDYNLAATGSCFMTTLRCMAVDSAYQGQGLMNQVVSELVNYQFARGNTHLFLYTKCEKARIFRDLGFYPIAQVDGKVTFMENRRTGFSDYIRTLQQETAASGLTGTVHGAVVMNANPFTLGHQYLLETASGQCDVLHVFVVSEDVSLVPAQIRRQLVEAGSRHIPNIVYHNTGSYMISTATFPSYFLKEEAVVSEAHARLDIAIFARIAQALGISRRFVGQEPFSQVTDIYNRIMAQGLTQAGIHCTVIPRITQGDRAISASQVRQVLKDGDLAALNRLVPPSTAAFFATAAAEPVLKAIREAEDVVHH